MGCDIHLYLEYRQKGEEWELHPKHTPDSSSEEAYLRAIAAGGRWYGLFGILANVRSNGCIYPPRGLPHDISKRLKSHTDIYLDHTPHWLTIKEFKRCLDKANKQNKQEIKDSLREDMQSLKNGTMTQSQFDSMWKNQSVETKPKSTDIFNIDWADTQHISPGWDDILPYVAQWEEELKAEYILLDQKPPNYEFRFVFYFDS